MLPTRAEMLAKTAACLEETRRGEKWRAMSIGPNVLTCGQDDERNQRVTQLQHACVTADRSRGAGAFQRCEAFALACNDYTIARDRGQLGWGTQRKLT